MTKSALRKARWSRLIEPLKEIAQVTLIVSVAFGAAIVLGYIANKPERDQKNQDMQACLKVKSDWECRAIMERRGLFR